MWDIRISDQTVSTNDDACALARSGAPAGIVCVARSQTGGHGRMDRSWFSPPGKGLYCSVLLRPRIARRQSGLLSFCASVAMSTAVNAGIKWPNDIMINRRKICGILSVWGKDQYGKEFAVIGSGLNICSGSYPPELKDRAACLEEFGMRDSPDAILQRYLSCLIQEVNELESFGFSGIRRRFEERCIIIGRPVRVSGGQSAEGIAESIGPEGELMIRNAAGELTPVLCGDVSVRGVNGYV